MQKRKGLFRLSILLFFVWLILINLGKEKASFRELTLASTLYFVGCLPFLIYLGRQEKNIPYLPVFGVYYFIYFSLSVFLNYDILIYNQLTSRIIIKCLTLALWGFISLLAAFYTPLGKGIDFMIIPLKIHWDSLKAFRIGVFAGLLGLITQYRYSYSIVPGIYGGSFSFIISLSRLGIAILFLLQLQNRLNLGSKLFLWLGLFIPRMLLDLITGSTSHVLLDFMLLFFLYFYYHRALPWLRIIIAGSIFFLIFSARDQFRGIVWVSGGGGKYASSTAGEKVSLYIKLIYENLTKREKKYVTTTYEKLSGRMDNLVTFSKVVNMTPERIPYWEGYTYTTLLTTFIPRFLMPEKPKKMLGQEFGHRYRLLSPSDVTSSYNLPILIEMYINFGPPAIIVGMFILGLIYRALYVLFNHPSIGDGGCLLSAMIFLGLLNIESDFSLIFGNIIQYIVLFYIILKTMRMPIERVS